MKSVSGSFGMVVYNTHKHIRAKESFDVWPLHHQMWHCSSTSFQAKDLVSASLSFCSTFQSTKSNLAEDNLNNSRATHINFHNTQWDRSVSTIMQWRMDTTFRLLHTLLGAASRSAEVSTAGSKTHQRRVKSQLRSMQQRHPHSRFSSTDPLLSGDFSGDPLPDSLPLQYISLPSKHSLGLQLPHDSQTLLMFSLFVLICWCFLFILIFAKPFVKIWF